MATYYFDEVTGEGRFARFAPEPRAVLPPGHSAEIDMRPSRVRIREASEKLRRKSRT